MSEQNFLGEEAGDTTKHISYQLNSRALDDRPLHPYLVAEMRMKERSSAAIVPSANSHRESELSSTIRYGCCRRYY